MMPDFIAGAVTGYVLLIFGFLIIGVLPMLAFPYLALRFRDSKAEKPDPELGIKAGYYFLFSLAIMVILFGLTGSAVDVLYGTFDSKEAKKKANDEDNPFQPARGKAKEDANKKEFFNITQRVAWGLVTSGTFFALVMMMLIRMGSNDTKYPAARRTFVGARLVVSGMIILLTISVFTVVMFQKKEKALEEVFNRTNEAVLAIAIVWLPTMIIHMILMRMYSSKPYHVTGYQEDERERPRRVYDD